jgi:hypothetical protein
MRKPVIDRHIVDNLGYLMGRTYDAVKPINQILNNSTQYELFNVYVLASGKVIWDSVEPQAPVLYAILFDQLKK